MTKKQEETNRLVQKKLAIFQGLQRKATDEAEWIALQFSVSRAKAERMIREATAREGSEP